MSNLSEKLEALKAKKAELAAEILAISKQIFKDEVTPLFEEHTILKSFSWRRYTPYFNDGEECVFRANTDEIDIAFTDDTEDDYYSSSNYSEWDRATRTCVDKPNLNPKQLAGKAALGFLHLFDRGTLKDMFGDHAEVIVTKDGVDVDSYAHD